MVKWLMRNMDMWFSIYASGQTDRQTVTLTTILRTPTENQVITYNHTVNNVLIMSLIEDI